MPEYVYINHKVKKGETLWGIARQYNVEEHKIIQSNPEVKITPKGKGIYDIANLKEGQILRIPQEKKAEKQGVKTITGNTSPQAGIKEKYRVTEWYTGTPPEMKNPAKVKWEVYYKEKGKYIFKLKKETGEFTFHEQAIGKDIKIVGYLYSPELDNDSALPVKVIVNKEPSLTSLVLYDIKKDKPLPKNAKVKLGQTLYAVAQTTHSVGKKVYFTLLKKVENSNIPEKEEETKYIIESEQEQIVSSKGTASVSFILNDFSFLLNSKNKQQYKINAQLEDSNDLYLFDNGVEVEKDIPRQKPKKEVTKKEEGIAYKGATALMEGWNNLKEKYKKLTTSEVPQIQKVSLYIPEGKNKVSYGESLTLKIKGKSLKDQSVEYTVYEDDGPLKDELDSGIVKMKGDMQEIEIQLTKEMYKKGGTSWLELSNGKHEIYIDVKIKGKIVAQSTGIIEVDTTSMKTEKLPGNRPVMDGEPEKIGECVCKDLIWGNKLTCEERRKVIQVCSNIWGTNQKKEKANMLMAVMHLETAGTFSPSKENGKGYVGLIQFHGSTAQSLGTTYEALKKMTFIQQMDYVEKYLKQNKDKMKTLVDFYLQVLKPNAVGQGSNPNYVVFDESISVPDGDGSNTSLEQRMKNINREPWVTKYGYSSNPPFMKEEGEHSKRKKWVYTRQKYEDRWGHHNGKTYIWEIEKEIKPKHYDTGIPQKYTGECTQTKKKEEKKEKGKRAPWMEYAISEIGVSAKLNGNNPRINEYFNKSTNGKGLNEATNWCGAFASWCFSNAGYTPPPLSCRAAMWQFWKQLDKPIYGAAAVIDWGSNQPAKPNGEGGAVGGDGHITFIVGISQDGNYYYCLGGNQGGVRNARTVKISKYSKSDIDWFVIPSDYEPEESEYKLKIMNSETDVDTMSSTRSN